MIDNHSLLKCKRTEPSYNSNRLRKRIRKRPIPDISANLDKIQRELNYTDSFHIRGRKKSARGTQNGVSLRRSRFMGVSRGVNHWQTLINIGKKKRYIDTYTSEVEAAIAFDFYSIGLHGRNAKTNFSYDAELLKQMILSFKHSEGAFNPSNFVQAIQALKAI
jgi:hypothetical protein